MSGTETGGPRQGSAKKRRYSAGILLYRRQDTSIQVLLGHMGGPLWSRRDVGAWSIPKGGYESGEEAQDAAVREFTEETGLPLPPGELLPLGSVIQANNKEVQAWALEGDVDPAQAVSNTFELQWPPKSGRWQSFPEFDRVAWFELDDAKARVVAGQAAFIDRLAEKLLG